MKIILEFFRLNKFMILVIPLIVGWGVWVTDGVYRARSEQEKIITICEDLKEMRLSIKENRITVQQNYINLFERLLDIQLQIKNGFRQQEVVK